MVNVARRWLLAAASWAAVSSASIATEATVATSLSTAVAVSHWSKLTTSPKAESVPVTGATDVALDASLDTTRASVDDLRVREEQEVERERARPSIPPIYGLVTSPFGERKSPFERTEEVFHAGIDIAAPLKSLFVAPADGLVTSVELKTGYGAFITIDHGHGILTKYAHVGTVLVSEGLVVKRGDAVGMVGMSGKTTGPHLHYEVWVDGKPTDPTAFLSLPTVKQVQRLVASASKPTRSKVRASN